MLLALCAGGVAASTPPPASARWTADPDDQFLLDVNIRQLKLGDGVRAYNTPEGTCVVLGDFLTALDVPVKVDLAARKASGWAFKESNRIAIDYGARHRQLWWQNRAACSGNGARNPRRLVRPDLGVDALVRDRGQAGHLGRGAGAGIGRQASGRARHGAPAAGQAPPSGQLRPQEPTPGPPAVPHVARARARFRRQRRSDLSRQGRNAGRPPKLGLCRGRDRPAVL